MVVVFCGHSDYTEGAADALRVEAWLESTVGDAQCDFYLGGYGAFDRFAHARAVAYRAEHPTARIYFVSPYPPDYLSPQKIKSIRESYDEIVYPELESVPLRYAIQRRNRWLAARADVVVACVERSFGGAYQTYKQALRFRKTVLNLRPLRD